VTYVLDGLRSLILDGWNGTVLLKGLLCIAAVTAVSFGLASAAMRGRVARK
jgi:ABC-type multidrug transport system permease subunit